MPLNTSQGRSNNSDTTTVTGTLQGPAGSTVLVNGITATVNGNGYSAANVPVGYGNTTLTATATAPDGSRYQPGERGRYVNDFTN